MVAELLGMELESLEVDVSGDVDVRGTLVLDPGVPVGFQAMRCEVRMRAKRGTPPRLLEKLTIASEASCVVLQTLRASPRVEVRFDSGP